MNPVRSRGRFCLNSKNGNIYYLKKRDREMLSPRPASNGMKIPNSKRKKALIIVDVQQFFLTDSNLYILKNIESIIQNVSYDLYINAVFYAPKGSIWDKQLDWVIEKNENNLEEPKAIFDLLKDKNFINIEKQTKSTFKGSPSILPILKEQGIEEIHIVGVDTNDCVLATAFESFDNEFFTYAIEECCQSSEGQEIHDAGLKILRHVNLTNNSCVEEIEFQEI